MKNKTKIKHWLFIILLSIFIWSQLANFFVDSYRAYKSLRIVKVDYAHAQTTEIRGEEGNLPSSSPEIGSLEWILNECEKNGIDPIKVKCLLNHESGFDTEAIGKVRTPDNVDLGLFQWSEKYQIKPGFISLGCIGNPDCELKKFIEKVKQDGNLYAWLAYVNNCMWLE